MTRSMTRSAFLAAAAILAFAIAGPASAQQVIYNPGYCAQFYPNANCQNRGPGSPYDSGYYQREAYPDRAWRNSYNRYDNGSTAIVRGPIGGDEYARRNGFVCTPGTWFRGEDGRRHICQ